MENQALAAEVVEGSTEQTRINGADRTVTRVSTVIGMSGLGVEALVNRLLRHAVLLFIRVFVLKPSRDLLG